MLLSAFAGPLAAFADEEEMYKLASWVFKYFQCLFILEETIAITLQQVFSPSPYVL